jgi:endonuclease/exonuclease/phosphatase family metal-dependent hydrolase
LKLHWALYGVVFLFFFQLIADFVEAIYAFGLLGTSIPVEITSLLFVFSPLLLLFVIGGLGRRTTAALAGLVFAARLAEPLLDTRGRMLVSGLGVSGFMLLFPTLLQKLEGDRDRASAHLGAGLALGVALSVLLRAMNSGSDLSTYAGYQVIAWVLALVAGVLLLRWLRSPSPEVGRDDPAPPASLGKVMGLSLGLAAALVLLYFAFTSPGVIARWTGANYMLVLAVAVLALAIFALVWARRVSQTASQRLASTLWVWNLAFVVALVLTILPYQIAFPADPGAYPLEEPQPHALAVVPLLLTLALYPVIFLDFSLLAGELLTLRPSARKLGAGFSLAALFILVMVFAQVFTTVYDYIPVVGLLFRDRFWLVFLALGIALILLLLLVKRGALNVEVARISTAYPVVVTLVGVGALVGAVLISARPAAPPPDSTRLRVLTYNVQQGYSKSGQKSFDEQIEVIREAQPDVVGLQETDTARIAGGNTDLVRYFADRLDMYSYYGPKTVAGTFGVALLSRYPIQSPRTFYMFSQGEQTAAIHAQVVAGSKTFNIFVTHLGNGGPIVQQEAILQETAGRENVVLVGDFNFRPDTEQYRLTDMQLDDAWLLRWPSGSDDQGLDPSRRIDHVFVSPGTQVADARYILSLASDHPAEVVEVEW